MNAPNETVRMIVAGTLNPPEVGSPEYDEWYEDAIAASQEAMSSSTPDVAAEKGYDACAAVLVSLGLAR